MPDRLETKPVFQLDFWRDVSYAGSPVDIRVPIHSLQFIKAYLEALSIDYSIMIDDLQA